MHKKISGGEKTAVDHCLEIRAISPGFSCDAGLIVKSDTTLLLGLIDVLGHGPVSHDLALTSRAFLAENHRLPLVELIGGLHYQVRNSRGLVAGLCRLNPATGSGTYVGIGNISARILGSTSHSLVSQDGIIGDISQPPREQKFLLAPGDLLLLHTAGVARLYGLEDDPELPSLEAKTIAASIMGRFARDTDDASCLVLKYTPQ